MKNKFKLIGIIALAAIFGFGIFSCDLGNENFTISYNANGGSGTTPATQTVNAGTSITVAGQGNLTYSGRIFGGWNTQANGSGSSYAAGSSMKVNANTTLYAQWIVDSGISYTVTYDANGGSGTAPAAQTVNAGVSITVAEQSGLTYAGRSFNGWNTQANGSGTSYAAGSSMTVNVSVTLYAQWTGLGNGGGSNYVWLETKQTSYNVTDGVASSVLSEQELDWIFYRHTSDTDWEHKYSSGSGIQHNLRNGQNYTFTWPGLTIMGEYDLASGLILKQTSTYATIELTSSYTIELQSDVNGIKTYKRTSDTSGTYSVYEIQNGITLEERRYSANGALYITMTYAFPDNAVIRAKLPTYTTSRTISATNPAINSHSTLEVISDSATVLFIRQKTFNSDNVLTVQYDTRFERFSVPFSKE